MKAFLQPFNFCTLSHFISCHASWDTFDPSVWPFLSSTVEMSRIGGPLSLSACAHVCYCRGVYLRGYLASQGWFLKRHSWSENHSGLCRYEELKKYKKLNPNVQKFFPQAVPWELCACMFTSCACYSLTLCVCSRHLAPRRHCRQKLIWKHRYAKACNDNKFQIPFSRIILSSTSWNLLKIKIIQW